jgi:hypothetical protein
MAENSLAPFQECLVEMVMEVPHYLISHK